MSTILNNIGQERKGNGPYWDKTRTYYFPNVGLKLTVYRLGDNVVLEIYRLPCSSRERERGLANIAISKIIRLVVNSYTFYPNCGGGDCNIVQNIS
ncbi:hypothetical protein M0802_013563 [Mischocyttarus mexicanus]|nr:hypothetical protein M0802_013565 [Mischocyttarus mexicanus]KAI4482958.1 hypothetical protein M0802_013563 [Mischocyttarus mexicanus]